MYTVVLGHVISFTMCITNYLSLAWDLLRIDVFGFKGFCQWFLNTYPTYFISPLRLSGSAIESLFSQYKYCAGGKLDSVNYTTSRAAHLVKQVNADRHSGIGYRDENLTFIKIPLQKKITNIHNHKHDYYNDIKTHDSESRGQEEVGRTRQTSELFTRSTALKFVNALNKPP